MRFHLTNAPLFRGMTPEEIDALLSCLNAKARACKKGEIILMEGAPTEQLGVVLSGRVIIEMSDVWGNNSVLSSVAPGGTFAEAYACIPGEPLMVNVVAAEDSTVLLLNARQVLTPLFPCLCLPRGADPQPADAVRGKEFAALPPDDAHQPQAHPHAAFILLLGMYQAKRKLCLRYSL